VTDRPSAFVDSPEDLVRKARALVDSGKLTPDAAVVVTDLTRELSKHQERHATRMSAMSANGEEMTALRTANKELLAKCGFYVGEQKAMGLRVLVYRNAAIFFFVFAFVGLVATCLRHP
jgi:hypothetical protein